MFYSVYLLIYLMFIYDSVKKKHRTCQVEENQKKKRKRKKIGALLETKSVTLKLHENFQIHVKFCTW